MTGPDTRTKFPVAKIYRGSQVIFGERVHLLEVLRSVQRARLPRSRRQAEVKQLQKLIAARTEELNRISPAWDRKFQKARRLETSSQELSRLAALVSPDDYLLARVLTEHAEAPPELLQHLASHPYSAVRENVARHPRTPQETLRQMATVEAEPLWFLVACNPSCPLDLRDKLRAKMKGPEGSTV
jgi:hypothetical protein